MTILNASTNTKKNQLSIHDMILNLSGADTRSIATPTANKRESSNPMTVLNVATDTKNFEITYNNISEHDLIKELNLQPTVFPAVTAQQEITALQNEMKILKHFLSLGFTHINDPQSSFNPYPIYTHLYYIKQHLTNYSKYTQTYQHIM